MSGKLLFTLIISILFPACLNNSSVTPERKSPGSDLPVQTTPPSSPPVTEEENPPITIDVFKLDSTDAAGWKQAPFGNSFVTTSGDSLYDVINGEAIIYIDRGYQRALKQDMIDVDSQKLGLMVFEFGSAETAESTFVYKTTTPVISNVMIPGYDSTVARGRSNSGGMTTFVRHENFFIIIRFDYIVSGTSVENLTRQFIDLLFEKAGGTGTAVRILP